MNQTIYFRKKVWDRFGPEEKKSELVNNLLERHYYDTVGNKTQKEVQEDIKIKTIDIIQKPRKLLDADYCKHGYTRTMCKYSKNGKPCKE